MFGLGTFANCSVSTCAYRCTFGISDTISFTLFLISYPPSVPGCCCSPAIVPPVATTRTVGRVGRSWAPAGQAIPIATMARAMRVRAAVALFIERLHCSWVIVVDVYVTVSSAESHDLIASLRLARRRRRGHRGVRGGVRRTIAGCADHALVIDGQRIHHGRRAAV